MQQMLQSLRVKNFDFCKSQYWKLHKITKIKILRVWDSKNGHFWLFQCTTEFDFMQNLSSGQFLKFPHCAKSKTVPLSNILYQSVERQEILSHTKNIPWNQLFSCFHRIFAKKVSEWISVISTLWYLTPPPRRN